jgi:hypothetical protein
MENLPKRSETHIQEERSRRAFRKVIPDHLFVIRDQFENDYGVDLILELVTLSGHVTNYQCQVQLKSVEQGKVKSDGSLNYAVPVKTINYLINQPSSIFVVYPENEDVFYWEWTDTINNYCDANGKI